MYYTDISVILYEFSDRLGGENSYSLHVEELGSLARLNPIW